VNHALFVPAIQSILPEIVPNHLLQQAYSMNSFISSIQQLVGVLLAGILYALLGIVGIFVINGVSFIVSGFSELFIRLNHQKSTQENTFKEYVKDLKGGLDYARKKEGLLGIFSLIILLNFAVAPIFSNVHPYLFNLVWKKRPFIYPFSRCPLVLARCSAGSW